MTEPTAPRGKAAPAYGTGRSESLRSGYVRIRAVGPLAGRDGYVYEHRLVWFEANGPIPDGFHVHHKDEDKTNNDPANLELKSNPDHQHEHSQPGTLRKNQYGAFPILDEAGRLERSRARSREYQRRRRAT